MTPRKTPSTSTIGINVSVDPVSIEAVGRQIQMILDSGADQKTLQAALRVFGVTARIKNATISGCTVQV